MIVGGIGFDELVIWLCWCMDVMLSSLFFRGEEVKVGI